MYLRSRTCWQSAVDCVIRPKVFGTAVPSSYVQSLAVRHLRPRNRRSVPRHSQKQRGRGSKVVAYYRATSERKDNGSSVSVRCNILPRHLLCTINHDSAGQIAT